MPYKPSLLTALYSDYEDAARKYMEARNVDAYTAEQFLVRMKMIGKNIKYTHQMMDGTMGKIPMQGNRADQATAYLPYSQNV